jgi:hypothetical protein
MFPDSANEADLAVRAVLAANRATVAWWGLPDSPSAWRDAVALLEVVLLVCALAAAAARFERWAGAERGSAHGGAVGARLAAAVAAAALGAWILLHPSLDPTHLATRFDHLVFALLAGFALRGVTLRVRIWTWLALSLAALASYIGWQPLAGMLAAFLSGYAATRSPWLARPPARVALHGTVVVGVLAWLWTLRLREAWAMQGLGLFIWIAFRYVSFAVEAARGATTAAAGFLCFLFFYPSCYNAIEVFREFRDRNLSGDAPIDYRAAAFGVAKGSLFTWIGLRIAGDPSIEELTLGFASAWASLLLAFFRAAFFLTGLWTTIEAGALLLGVRLRPNFTGLFTSRSPSDFWRAWRATMTNWFILYVYRPLGGNRKHQTANIFAVFALSTAWHCLALAAVRPAWTPLEMLPIALWGLANFAGVAGHAAFRRARRRRSGDAEPRGGAARVAADLPKLAGTYAFAAVVVALLGFPLQHVDRLADVFGALAGLRGW